MKNILYLILSTLCLYLGSCADLMNTNAFNAKKSYVEVDYGGAHSIQTRYILSRDSIIREYYYPHQNDDGEILFRLNDRMKVPILNDDFARLVNLISDLNINTWKSKYSPQMINTNYNVLDGEQWMVMYREESNEYRITGDNTYPNLLPLGKPTLNREQSAYYRLIQILEQNFKNLNNKRQEGSDAALKSSSF